MMLSLPSAPAAASRPLRPPQSDTDVAVLAVQPAVVAVEPPHAATVTKATAITPRWRNGLLLNFMLPSPCRQTETGAPSHPASRGAPRGPGSPGDQYAGEILLSARRCCKDGDVSPRLRRGVVPGIPAGGRGQRQR